MAASTRAITPTHTGPFPVPNRSATPNSHAGATFGTHLTKSPRGLSPRRSPQPLTGATALNDERQRQHQLLRQSSPNPAHAVVQSLIGTAQSAVNNSKDAPARASGAMDKVQKPLVIPEAGQMTGDNMQTSPVSLSSFGSNDSNHASNAPAMEASTPQINMEGVSQQHQQPPPPQQQQHHQHIAPNPNENPSNRAFTFPGPLAEHDPRAPTRQMSLPGYQNSPKSPSTKRHKCPYCATDFTRHHNLKSHLLTHSQEKPYECPTCQARFRRLHDLKRHTKLHTGERPHTCPKCGRRFARGDALARHNKGQGGCAGRRSSFGLDNEEMVDGKGEDGMDGVIYHGEHDGEGDDDDDGRRVSEPARKRQNTGNSTQAPGSLSNLHYTASQANMFSQGGPPMTESPKPLSPGQQDQHRLGTHDASMPGSRSPNIHPNFQRARGSPSMGMAPPQANNGPHLPALPGLAPSMLPKQGSQGGSKNGPSMLQHQQVPGSSSQPGSVSSHGASSGGSMREVMGNQGIDMWQYVRDMEARMAKMAQEHESKMTTLQTEVTTLRAQLAQQHAHNTQQQ
ncbi:hypothetical protein P171DRAFT_83819 [Karstenula rhodostoma CBS 690.94]|uniref:C2H2-type domain-containing protein n=1 Tax=Karstenula rhodostoma CBS 690.94 TaxID=1392251 RepID=A0A9P4PCF9_9PLEO|nr:hypothetical protein P171DRAFT_83819 [Karstenula rhodostoma CBS 690.94]